MMKRTGIFGYPNDEGDFIIVPDREQQLQKYKQINKKIVLPGNLHCTYGLVDEPDSDYPVYGWKVQVNDSYEKLYELYFSSNSVESNSVESSSVELNPIKFNYMDIKDILYCTLCSLTLRANIIDDHITSKKYRICF